MGGHEKSIQNTISRACEGEPCFSLQHKTRTDGSVGFPPKEQTIVNKAKKLKLHGVKEWRKRYKEAKDNMNHHEIKPKLRKEGAQDRLH